MGNENKSQRYNPTPGVYYTDENEARKAELERAEGSWDTNSIAEKATDDPNEFLGGSIDASSLATEKKELKPIVAKAEALNQPGLKLNVPTGVDLARRKEEALGRLEQPDIDLSGATDESTTNALAAASEQVGQSDGQNAISQAYHSPIKDLSDTISNLEQKKKDAMARDEKVQRRARNMQMIAGISDGLASLANLIGVAHGGSNINLGDGALTPLQQRLEEDRKERKADIKSIDDRLDQYRRQLEQMKLQKGLAVAEQGNKDRVYDAEQARHAENILMKKAELAYQKDRDKVEDAHRAAVLAEQKRSNQATESARLKQIANDYSLGLKRLEQSSEQAGLKGNYPVIIGDNEKLDIPKEQINDTNVGRIFGQLPKEFQDLAQGKPTYKYNEYGEREFAGYEPPTNEEKLAAIGVAARNNPDIQDELRKLAGTYKPGQRKGRVSEIDDSHLNPLGTISMEPSSGKKVTGKVNWSQFE